MRRREVASAQLTCLIGSKLGLHQEYLKRKTDVFVHIPPCLPINETRFHNCDATGSQCFVIKRGEACEPHQRCGTCIPSTLKIKRQTMTFIVNDFPVLSIQFGEF